MQKYGFLLGDCPMIRSRTQVQTYIQNLVCHRVNIALFFGSAAIFSFVDANDQYHQFSVAARYGLNFFWAGMYLLAAYVILPIWVNLGIRRNIPVFWILCIFYMCCTLSEAVAGVVIFSADPKFSSMAQMVIGNTLCIVPGCIIIILYVGEAGKNSLASPGSDCPVWRPVRTAKEDPMSEQSGLVYMKSQNQYTLIVTTNSQELKRISLSQAIANVDPALGARVHRSYWVANDHIATLAFKQGNPRITTSIGDEIPISRSSVPEVKARLG